MDITLERILSLIPKKPNGKYVHGAKTEFARSIGFTEGNIVSMWENGTSKSYRDYIYNIAAVYDVSVAWLKGETDDPTPPGANSFDQAVLEFVHQLPPDKLRGILLLLGAPKELLDALDREAPQE